MYWDFACIAATTHFVANYALFWKNAIYYSIIWGGGYRDRNITDVI